MRESAAELGEEEPDVIYCVAAMIDLLGFSAHLETGANDVRTSIGRAAITRLEALERVLGLIDVERASAGYAYPANLAVHRINDALILHLDLPQRLRPSTGERMRTGFSINELETQFELGKYLDDEENGETHFHAAFLTELNRDIQDLSRFIGLVARLHLEISAEEQKAHFPGAKTICATGLRRRFVRADGTEDRLAANFAYANAYAADSQLHGAHLFLDDNIAQLVCINEVARNIVRHANFVTGVASFDPATDPMEGFYSTYVVERSKPTAVSLFRASYHFRRVSPVPLTFLQLLPELTPLLDGTCKPPKSVFSIVAKQLASGPDITKMRLGEYSQSIRYPLDFSFPLNEFLEVARLGKSEAREKRQREELMKVAIMSIPQH